MEHVAQQEHHLVDRRPVGRHDVAPSSCRARRPGRQAGDPPLLAICPVF
jgi:hypothetical protein